MKKVITTIMLACCTLMVTAQNIDFDLPGKTAPGKDTEINYISWAVPRAASDTKTFDNGMTITISAGGAAADVGSSWNKTDVETNGLRVIADEVLATNIVNGNLTQITEGSTSLILTITGMTAGTHTLKAYHNNSDKNQTQPDIEVKVDGQVVATGVKFTSAARSNAEAGTSFITFNVTERQPVVITYSTVPEQGKTYTNTRMMINGLEFDVAEIVATDPQPENHNFHAGTEDGTIAFSWTAPEGIVGHKMVLGNDSAEVANATVYEYEGTEATYVKSGLSSMQKYWWRIDEVDGEGRIHKGTVWVCQPCHLAFPGAEGYGRYAIGGRGGVVYHVTSLSGGMEPGTLLYGLVQMDEPRYIVFDVSGIIELDFKSRFVKPFAYIAGQTAPGKGICIKASNINIGSDVICRHMRFKRGLGVYGENTGNAMGLTGADHAIVDHCTAAWGTDETVSGRGALNVSFQYSMISEALGIAGHKNYEDGKNHGFAATIDGRIGSWHHNLLVNCNGRNWSMGGGMDGQNRPIGGLDLFNNVVYNWNGRTTDGNCHEVNFVNNYYKMGADTKQTKLITLQFELKTDLADNRTNTAYVAGNIRENKNHTLTYDKLNDTYNANGYVPTDYQYFVNDPLFPSYATIHTAKDAMKIVTSYAGATMPMRDEHHQRNIRETIGGTWTYKGSKSGIKGEIDTEEDITEHAAGKGWEEYPEEHRAADWDTDQDGMPDWWEQCVGSNASVANQNDDPDGDGWTLIEDYLEFMAHPYVIIQPNGEGSIDLRKHFAGFYGQNATSVTPTYTVDFLENHFTASIEGDNLKVKASETGCVGYCEVTVNDGETAFTQRFGVAVTNAATTGISEIFSVVDGLFDATIKETMGLGFAPGAETVTVFAATDDSPHYANGVVMTAYKGDLYCMWQTSAKDEDAQDTWVAYARSTDGGTTWSSPMVLCPTISNGYCASGGWLSTDDRLIGYINVRTKDIANSGGYTQYVESTDGLTWTEPQDVTMADGSQLNGIFEQDPHVLSDGRIICAAHFQPGLKLCSIYTDDPTGRTGWKKGQFQYTDNGSQSAELEPSFFLQQDGTLVMTMRDQKGSYKVLAATSNDRGETWTKAVRTNMPDSRAKQCAGNLPDGTAFLVNNPGRVTNSSNTTWRVPLALTLSADGKTFDRSYLLRSGNDNDYTPRRYEGKAKTLGYSYPKALVHGDYLYVSYSTNKDDAQYTRVPINNISLNTTTVDAVKSVVSSDGATYNLSGQRVNGNYKGMVIRNGKKYFITHHR